MRIAIIMTKGKELHIHYADGRKVIRYCPSDAAAQQRLTELLETQS